MRPQFVKLGAPKGNGRNPKPEVVTVLLHYCWQCIGSGLLDTLIRQIVHGAFHVVFYTIQDCHQGCLCCCVKAPEPVWISYLHDCCQMCPCSQAFLTSTIMQLPIHYCGCCVNGICSTTSRHVQMTIHMSGEEPFPRDSHTCMQ